MFFTGFVHLMWHICVTNFDFCIFFYAQPYSLSLCVALLQEKKLLDLPKLLDICAIYGHDNEKLTGLLVRAFILFYSFSKMLGLIYQLLALSGSLFCFYQIDFSTIKSTELGLLLSLFVISQ